MRHQIPLIFLGIAVCLFLCCSFLFPTIPTAKNQSYIKWVEFNIPSNILYQAITLDIESRNSEERIDSIRLLSFLAAKNGGNFKNIKIQDVKDAANYLSQNHPTDLKNYSYYLQAYSAIMNGWLGEYETQVKNADGTTRTVLKYGLTIRHPVKGGYSDSDDFGNQRSYGFQRKHQGHDFFTATGTPVSAVEDGVVEVMGWNRYGGWRIGIRSFDGKRYYYYAHLRQNFPYALNLEEGSIVTAGDVIGYMGHTGYSTVENTNNIDTVHLHWGLQLIFDESQKEGNNEIWIDCYELTKFLYKNRSLTKKNPETKEWTRIYQMKDPAVANYMDTL